MGQHPGTAAVAPSRRQQATAMRKATRRHVNRTLVVCGKGSTNTKSAKGKNAHRDVI
jgi:hypothetical protein